MAEPSIILRIGQEQPWPAGPQRLQEGEVVLIGELIDGEDLPLLRRSLRSFRAPCDLPGLGAAEPGLMLRLKAVAPARMTPLQPTGSAGSRAELSGEETPASSLRRSLEVELERIRGQVEHFDAFDSAAEHRQVLSFEHDGEKALAGATPETQSSSGETADPLLAVAGRLARRYGTVLHFPRHAPGTPRGRLLRILRSSGMIAREIIPGEALLRYDCGDLVAFRGDAGEQPLLLLSDSGHYSVWDPGQASTTVPTPPAESLTDLDQRLISVQPASSDADLSIVGLLRFLYGQARNGQAWILGGLLIGLAIGFTLAMAGQGVSAGSIVGLGVVGLAAGILLSVLSGGFRLATLVMIASTTLGLLTPAFNTLLTNSALPERDFALVLQMGGILMLAALLEVTLQWTQSRVLLLVQHQGAARLQFASLDRLLKLPASFFVRMGVGELAMRFAAFERISTTLQALLAGGLLKVLLSGLYLLFMLRISPSLTLLTLAMAALLLIPTSLIGWQSQTIERRRVEAAGMASSRNLELISSVGKLRLAGAEPAAARYWGEVYRRTISATFALDEKTETSSLLQIGVPALGTLLLYLLIPFPGHQASQMAGQPSPNLGELIGFFSAYGSFIAAMVLLANLGMQALTLPTAFDQARPILAAVPENRNDAIDPGELNGDVELERASFRYSPTQPLILDKVSLQAAAGEFVALVGPSGSGKSTLIRLLLGLEQPEEGWVRFDGRPLQGLDTELVRRQIGTVLQSSGIFPGSLFEVIAGGSIIRLDQAWQAAEMVALADDIHRMPMGMHTVIPEGGGTLSGGQRQRLAIARALVREPKLLLFDEATSALDNRTQAVVTRSLESLRITRIVIAHRLSTIRRADRIYVLARGRIQQVGTFSSLMAEQGLFADMMRRQVA
jgi:ATP-binding cassette, subfamily B, bacterial